MPIARSSFGANLTAITLSTHDSPTRLDAACREIIHFGSNYPIPYAPKCSLSNLVAMEVFAAISLAGNIIEFVDYGLKLCSWAYKVHSTATGFTDPDERLMLVTLELKALAERLDSCAAISRVKPEAKAVRDLAIKCADLAQELVELLEEFQAKNPKSKRESFKIAWKKVFKEDEQKQLEQRLANFSSELNLHLTQLSR
jgi:hypothetical protein